MTLRGWLALFVIYVAYLFLGAFLFHALECPQELAELEDQEQEDDHLTGKIRAMWDELEEQRKKVKLRAGTVKTLYNIVRSLVDTEMLTLRSWSTFSGTGGIAALPCATL